MYTTFCSSIHLSIDIWVVIIFWLLWIMLLWTWVFKSLLPILLNIYLELEFLHHMVILCLIFYTAASPFYSPTSDTQGFQFLHIFANTSNVCEVISHRGFDLYFPISQWCEASFQALISLCTSPLQKYLFKYFAHF